MVLTASLIFSSINKASNSIGVSTVSACTSGSIGVSSDVQVNRDFIIVDKYTTVQVVDFENPEDDSCPILIDSISVSYYADDTTYPSYLATHVCAYIDDGDGVLDVTKDEQLDCVSNCFLANTVVLGEDNNQACLEILPGTSERVFIRFSPFHEFDDVYYIRTMINATDCVNTLIMDPQGSYYPSTFASEEGVEIGSRLFRTKNRSDVNSVSLMDKNSNGLCDEIHVDVFFPVDDIESEGSMYFDPDENAVLSELSVTYKGEDVNIESIDFITFIGGRAIFKIVLDEDDTSLQIDTSSDDFFLSYQSDGDEHTYPLSVAFVEDGSIGYTLAVEYFDADITDNADPIITDATVSDTLITSEDVDSQFTVTYEFSEAMDQNEFPSYGFNPDINVEDTLFSIHNQEWISDSTYQVSFTVEEQPVFYENVDIICSAENAIDLDGNQMNTSFSAQDMFMVDMKPPQFSDFPSDLLSPDEDYTMRVTATDDNDIDSVILHYQFDGNWNTKTMEYDLGNDQYYALVNIPETATDLHYQISAYDIYENTAETDELTLSVGTDIDDEEEPEETDTDEDGYPDDMEESYGTNATDATDYPLDTDEDGIPDDDSSDGKYTGDTDDDGDGVPDEIEDLIGSDAKDGDDVTDVDDLNGYLIDTTGDGKPDSFYEKTDETVTNVSIDAAGDYQIDVDGDGTIDYLYDDTTGTTIPFEQEKTEDSTPGFTTAFVFIAIAAMIIVFLIFIRRPRF